MWTNEHITSSGAITEYAEQPLITEADQDRVAPKNQAAPIALLGVPFDNVTRAQALERIDRMIASGRPHYVVTANVDFCIQALEDVELHRIFFDAHLVLCDGTPLVWASKLFGNPLPERVAGADLVPLIIQRAAEKGYRVFFLGGAARVTEQAVERMRALHPNLVVAGHYSPPFRSLLDMDHDDICRRIREARPDLLFVSFGCPKAEKWMAMHYRTLGVPVAMGVGATIDFLAGRMRRAPAWMQRNGVEWLYRLTQEPRRLWPRYAKDFRRIGPPLLAQFWLQRVPRARAARSAPAITFAEPTWARVEAPKHFDRESLVRDAEAWNDVIDQHCLLDLSAVECFDSTALAFLIKLHHRLSPWSLVLLHPSRVVQRVLRRFKLESFFRIAGDTIEAREMISEASAPAVLNSVNGFRPVPPMLWTGELTAINSEEVWNSTRDQLECLSNARQSSATIDLSELRFIDSTGVGVMLRAKRYAQSLGTTLHFINPQADVRNVLQIARLEVFLLHS